LTASFPWYTPYQFAGNRPIEATDLDGLEEKSSKGNVNYGYVVTGGYVTTEKAIEAQVIEKAGGVILRTVGRAGGTAVLVFWPSSLGKGSVPKPPPPAPLSPDVIERINQRRNYILNSMSNEEGEMAELEVLENKSKSLWNDLDKARYRYLASKYKVATDGKVVKRQHRQRGTARIDVDDIHVWESKGHDERSVKQLMDLYKTVKEIGVGEIDPIEVVEFEGKYYMFNGHHRLALYKELDFQEVTVTLVDDLTILEQGKRMKTPTNRFGFIKMVEIFGKNLKPDRIPDAIKNRE